MSPRSITYSRSLPKTFAALSRLHPLRPISDKIAFENAKEIADVLAVLDRRSADQEEYLESLSVLMEHYESAEFTANLKDLNPVEMLRYLMQNRAMSESDLGRLLGERSLGNAVLSGRRSLSKLHVRILADHFKVSTDLFLK